MIHERSRIIRRLAQPLQPPKVKEATGSGCEANVERSHNYRLAELSAPQNADPRFHPYSLVYSHCSHILYLVFD